MMNKMKSRKKQHWRR